MVTFDLFIVGAGPIGLELAVAASKAGLNYAHVDARQIGHTISWWAPQTRWFSSNERIAIAGMPLVTSSGNKATREEYLAYLRTVVLQHKLNVRTYEPVTDLWREGTRGGEPTDEDSVWVVSTLSKGEQQLYRTRRIVLATGGTERPAMLNIPGENLPHVSHYFDDPHKYFNKRVLIVGGKNSAAEAALRCYHAGAQVTVSYRGLKLPAKSIKYWVLPELEGFIEKGRIEARYETTPIAIDASGVTLYYSPTEQHRRWEGDFVLLMTGYEADMTLFERAGVTLAERDGGAGALVPAFNPDTMETDAPGVYVAGTAAAGTQHKYELFLENSHVHVERIIAHVLGRPDRNHAAPTYAMPET